MSYRCSSCAETLSDWSPRCPCCGLRGAILDDTAGPDDGAPSTGRWLESIRGDKHQYIATGIPAVDEVLGGGFVAGSSILLGGIRGSGKSTLLLQAFAGLAESTPRRPLLYAALEEPEARIKVRAAERLTIPRRRLVMLQSPTLEELGREIDRRPRLLAVGVDPIHGLLTEAPYGPRRRLVACAETLTAWAQTHGLIVLLLAHMSRKREIAGPMQIEHVVDVVLHLEASRGSPIRTLRAEKNRFGPTDMVGKLEMTGRGLV